MELIRWYSAERLQWHGHGVCILCGVGQKSVIMISIGIDCDGSAMLLTRFLDVYRLRLHFRRLCWPNQQASGRW